MVESGVTTVGPQSQKYLLSGLLQNKVCQLLDKSLEFYFLVLTSMCEMTANPNTGYSPNKQSHLCKLWSIVDLGLLQGLELPL